MSISFTSKVVTNDNVLFREMDGEAVILNLNNECYYGLDAVGTRMWNVMTTTPSLEEAHRQLLEEYDVESETLKRDIENLVDELKHHGMIAIINE